VCVYIYICICMYIYICMYVCIHTHRVELGYNGLGLCDILAIMLCYGYSHKQNKGFEHWKKN